VTGRSHRPGGVIAPYRPRSKHAKLRRRHFRTGPVIIAVLILAVGISLLVKLTGESTPPRCQASFVPAFFGPGEWTQAAPDGNGPQVIILNPASGPGPSPDASFQSAVRSAQHDGTQVIGYIGTEYGQRPAAQVRAWIRDYHAWYGVNGIFLDQTPTDGSGGIGYYRALAADIHQLMPGAPIWLNPGVYPDRAYMSVGSVVMAFEGSYASYQTLRIPAWARQYQAGRFAHTVYATPQSDLASAVGLSRQRNAGYVFVTPLAGANPYGAVPSYWPREQAAVAGGHCRAGGS
jgi:hypothetical protein